jgi:PAS domain S-box-containing protein
VVSKDITDRMRADEAVRESNDQYQNLLRRSNDCIYIHDLEGNFIDANPAALELLGYAKKDIPNISFTSLLSPDQIPKALAALEEIKEAGTERAVREFRLKRKDGKYVDTETKSFLVYSEGEPYAVQGIARDITERKESERDRELLLAELEAKNKELESFVYSISHDLKTPLVSLQGFSSLLQREFHDQVDEEGKHYMERIQANVAHMDSLISDLLGLSRIGRAVGPMEKIDVGALLKEIQQDLVVELEEAGAELVVNEPLPIVDADPGRIRQVFTNLIDNALKFRSEDRPLRIKVGCKEERGSYRIHVADNGIGIAPLYQEQIFNPFRKLDPKTEGMGIGLALVKKIMESHDGRVWVESEAAEGQEGGGATFYLTLPRREES